jgi:1,2-diacylglycerol 3-alpha-glucosyltransferase
LILQQERSTMSENRKLKIGIFNDTFPPILDGVGSVTRNYAYWLNRDAGQVTVVTPRVPDYTENEEFHVLRFRSVPLPGNKPFRWGLPWLDPCFNRCLSRLQFDIIHAHSPFVTGRIGLKVRQRQDLPMVASFHSKYRDDLERIVPDPISFFVQVYVDRIARFYNATDEVWIPNRSTEETLREYGYTGPVQVVENATDIIAPADLAPLRESLNDRHALTNGKKVFLYIGQHIWEKNHRTLIEALKILKEKYLSDYMMLFIGMGYAAKQMERLSRKIGLENEVKFIGPVNDREELKKYYARADLFVFPSLYDTSPLTLRESAAFRLPTLLIKNSTASEHVTDEVNGFLSENDPESLARRMFDAGRNRDLLQTVGENAKKSFHRTWREVAEEVSERYREIIARH